MIERHSDTSRTACLRNRMLYLSIITRSMRVCLYVFIWFMLIIASSQAHRAIRVDLPYSCSIKNKYLVFFSSTTGLSPCSLWYPCATFSSYGLSWFIASRYSHGANHSCCSLIRLSRVRAIVKADKTVAIRSTEYR